MSCAHLQFNYIFINVSKSMDISVRSKYFNILSVENIQWIDQQRRNQGI